MDTIKIPTLDEVFKKFGAGKHKWILDIKETGLREQLLPWVKQRFASDQVILFGTHEVLEEYKGEGYRLGYTVIYKNVENRLSVLLWPSSILDNCDDLGCDFLVLPMIFANQYLIDGAKKRKEISGKEAYQLYIDHTIPFIKEAGARVTFMGKGGAFLIA